MTADELVRGVDRLVDRIAQWTPSRWAVSTAPDTRWAVSEASDTAGAVSEASGAGNRADTVHALAQRLADLEAEATGRRDRAVPRLENDLVLPDQVRVTARDLLAANPPPEILAAAVEAIAATRRALAS